ncbi:MAG: hypothetical protein Fues2KO_33660 [Fuerstiella sp.]
MIVHAWKNEDGLQLSRPDKRAELTTLEFDPDAPCTRCGQRVLSISATGGTVCPWCESSMARPKILPYQEDEMVRLLQRQSDLNEKLKPGRRRLLRNRSTERDLRAYLADHGYYGRSAEFFRLELAGIERPGWVQVFEFHVYAKSQEGGWSELFGTVRTDERNQLFDVRLAGSVEELTDSVRESTREMLSLEREDRHWAYWPLMIVAGLLIAVAALGAIIADPTTSTTPANSVKVGQESQSESAADSTPDTTNSSYAEGHK